ncbi:putative subtilisin [Trichoderma camerunense]
MASSISINGRKVALGRDLDVSDTNYIVLCTKGLPLNKKQKVQLQELGVRVEEFVGDEKQQIYLCGFSPDSLNKVQALDFVEYAGQYMPEFALTKKTQLDSKSQTCNVAIMLHHDVEEISEELTRKIAEVADVDPSAIVLEDGGFQIKVATNKLDGIAALDEVRVLHTANETTLFDNKAREILRLDDAVATQDTPNGENTAYRGEGQIVCVADTGLDRGSDTNVHEAFAGRVRGLFAWGRAPQNLTDDLDGHGTHVCGSVLGKGQHKLHGLVEGAAPAAELLMQSLFSKFNPLNNAPRLDGLPKTNLAPLFQQAYDAGARVHTNSWGSALPLTRIQRPYDGRSESIDRFVWEHQDMTILFAAGNDGQDADLDGNLDGTINERSLGAEAAAKNSITVGATENNRPDLISGDATRPYTYGGFWSKKFAVNPLRDDHMADNPHGLAAFSSRGPTAENRLKPDVVAPGTAILSARSQSKKYLSGVHITGQSGDDKYMYLAGTSMSTPLVAGCCAVLRQALLSNGYQDEGNGVKNPTGALIKALLINGAVPVGGQYMPDGVNEGYNPHSGFGRVDLAASLPKINDPCSGYGVGVAHDDDETPFQVQIPIPETDEGAEGSWTLKATLAYADLPGGRLQHDLNLVVAIGEHERHGNQMNSLYSLGSTDGFDRNNNVEQVVWRHVPAGTAHVIVKPFRFMAERVPFAYAWRLTQSS